MKYKAGDKVRIKSIDWYEENMDDSGSVYTTSLDFTSSMSVFCGQVMTIQQILHDGYHMKEDLNPCKYVFADEMIEGLAEEEPTSEPQPIDLTQILKDCPIGTPLWSAVYGDVALLEILDKTIYKCPIKVQTKYKVTVYYDIEGYHYSECKKYGAEPTLFPSKEQRDWSKFKAPHPDLPIDTPVMVIGIGGKEWRFAFYSGKGSCYVSRAKEQNATTEWDYIIPVDKFNFNDPDSNKNSEYNYGTKGGGQ